MGGSKFFTLHSQLFTFHNLLHHLRDALWRFLAGRIDDALHLRLRESETGHHLHQHFFAVVANRAEVHGQLMQLHVSFTVLWFPAVKAPPLVNNRGVGHAFKKNWTLPQTPP